jgi:hypothetical protein
MHHSSLKIRGVCAGVWWCRRLQLPAHGKRGTLQPTGARFPNAVSRAAPFLHGVRAVVGVVNRFVRNRDRVTNRKEVIAAVQVHRRGWVWVLD